MRRDVFEKLQADVCKSLRRRRHETFGLKVLLSYNHQHPSAQPCKYLRASICGLSGVHSYLNVKVVVDLDDVPKEKYVLHETGKFPHISKARQYLLLCRGYLWLHCAILQRLGLVAGPLETRHGGCASLGLDAPDGE